MQDKKIDSLRAMKVIAYRPEIAEYLGDDIPTTIFFQQIEHWAQYSKRADGKIYKTAQEMYEETRITEKRQRRCRRVLVELGWIDAEKLMANGQMTWHYSLLMTSSTVLSPVGSGLSPVGSGLLASSITKNTHKNTHTSEVDTSEESVLVEDLEVNKLYRGWLIEFVIGTDYWARLDQEKRDENIEKAMKRTRLTPKRKKLMLARLKTLGFKRCAVAIKRCAAVPWNQGDNPTRWKASIEYLFRNDEFTEEWSNRK